MERNPMGSAESFWTFLEEQFADPLQEERARNKLNNFFQKKHPLQAFNAEFMRLAYEAGENENHSNLKSLYLRALRPDLKDRMISVDVPKDWTINQLHERVVRIEENLYRSKLTAPNTRNQSKADRDAMDWEPTRANAGRAEGYNSGNNNGKERAKWVHKDIVDQRRKDGRCLRCGKAGHFIQKCALAPARRPASARAGRTSDDDGSDDDHSDIEGSKN
jgi:hypothetical protein